jgi:hypothetical protein
MLHETFWFRAHGIEGFSYVEENHDPRHHHNQCRALPVRHRGNLESAALTMGVGVTAGASLGLNGIGQLKHAGCHREIGQ